VLNLSGHGVKLALEQPIPEHRSRRLRFTVPQPATVLFATAKMCWSQPGSEGEHLVGCRLSSGSPDGLLRQLAAESGVGRRESPRTGRRWQFTICSDADPFLRAPATLLNFPQGGFCLQTALRLNVGERIRVVREHPEPATPLVVACWELQLGAESHWGCRCASADAYDPLRQALESAAHQPLSAHVAHGDR